MHERLRWRGRAAGRVWLDEPEGRLWHRHHHDEPEFNLVLRGRARYLLSDQRYDLERGSLVWLFPRQEHLLVELSPDYAAWIGVIRPDVLRRAVGADAAAAGLLAARPAGCFSRVLAPADAAFLDRLCRDVAAGAEGARGGVGLPYLFLAAWDRFQRAGAGRELRLPPPLAIATAVLSRDPSADAVALAAEAGVTRFHLVRLFRRHLGTTLLAWRTRARIERAMALRRAEAARGWAEIAAASGFGSYAQFRRAFTALTGASPRRWSGG